MLRPLPLLLLPLLVAMGTVACSEDAPEVGNDGTLPLRGEPRAEAAGDPASFGDPEADGAPILAWDSATAPVTIPGWQRITEPRFVDLDSMVESRIIRAAVVNSRSLFFMDGADPRGITYEGLSRFEDFLNDRLGTGLLRVHVVMIPVRRDQLLPALVEGRVDLAVANLTVTPDRLELVDFSAPLRRGVEELLVTGPEIPAPAGPDDLSGLEIHVRPSSSYFRSLQNLNAAYRSLGLDSIRIRAADELLEDEDILELVNAGVIPATVVDDLKAQLWSQVYENIVVHSRVPVAEGGEIAWAFRKGSPLLRDLLADFAREHRQGTFLGNMALRKYLGAADRVVNPLDRSGEERLEAMLPVFETYAARYDLDPLLLISQAYQESRLDPDAVSRVGAVGVMQLMPSTAADPNIGIPDITSVENNVHAGAKYLRFLLDRYFSDGELDLLNEHLFVFAAYNAGPTRVARLRAEAAEVGLDPDRWFQNVEVVAARRIGRETVQYVSNIYKYYLTYSRIQHLEGA